MAVSSAWYHKFAAHKPLYGSAISFLAVIYAGMSGHDIDILRGISQGYYDLEAAHDLMLNITNLQTLWVIAIASDIAIFAGIAYAVITYIAHGKIARDSIGYRPF